MKRILLPTDFSDNSIEAIKYALTVFRDMECTFFLLHTYTPPIYQTAHIYGSPGQLSLGDAIQEKSLTQIEKLKAKLENQYNNTNHTFNVHTAFNTLVSEVMETVATEKIDMIVMGTTGATGAKEILFGSNAVHIIKKSNCPVLVVPPNFEYEAPKEILFPTDYEITYQKNQFDPLLALLKLHKSRINVLHVRTGYDLNKDQTNHKKQLENLLGNSCLFHEMKEDEIINAINTFQLKTRINLLVMVQNKHTFFERLFIAPVIKKIGLHITVPFMVIPQLQKI